MYHTRENTHKNCTEKLNMKIHPKYINMVKNGAALDDNHQHITFIMLKIN